MSRNKGKTQRDAERYWKKHEGLVHNATAKQEEPLNMCFYGRESWYASQTSVLNLDSDVGHANFDDLPDNLDALDVLVVDAIIEKGELLANLLIQLIVEKEKSFPKRSRTKIVLSYNPKEDISDLRAIGYICVPYTKPNDLKEYLETCQKKTSPTI